MKPIKKIGIVGGGQLGKMLTIAAKQLGFFVTIIDPTPQSPAGQVADEQIVATVIDPLAIRKLAASSDVITFEVELANDEALFETLKAGIPVNPSPQTLGIIRNKLRQKVFLKRNLIPVADFLEIKEEKDIEKAIARFGFPLMLKAQTDAYDGRGNALIKSEKDIKAAFEKLKNRPLYVEKFVKFQKELAIMVARNLKGEIATYPVVETQHIDSICDIVIAPAQVSSAIGKKVTVMAEKIMKSLKGAGVFGIEMFLEVGDNILVNEIAPRVHNAGHFTIESCITSQFEQHIRAITGLPLGSTDMLPKVAVMKNILGSKPGDGYPKGIEKALKIPGVSLHIYGKLEAFAMRKMGHITVVGNSVDECLKKVEKARKALEI